MNYLWLKYKWVRNIYSWWYHYKLRKVAQFIENHHLYPVNLNKDLLEVWKRK